MPGYGPGAGPLPPWAYVPQVPKPGVVPLAPLTVGNVVSGVFTALQRYTAALFVPLAWVALGSTAALSVYAAVAVSLLRDVGDDLDAGGGLTGEHQALLTGTAIGGALLLVVALTAAHVVATATSTAVLRHAVVGRKASTRQIWAESRPVIGRIVLSVLLVSVIVAGIMLVSALPALLLGIATGGTPLTVLAMLLMVPGWLFATYVQVRLVLEVPVIVLEDMSATAALRRAWRLNEGAWWRSLGIPYLVNLIGSAVAQFALVPFVVVGVIVLLSSSHTPDAYGAESVPSVAGIAGFAVCTAVGSLVTVMVTAPLTPLTNGLLYIDRRIRRESLDVTLAAAAGIAPWPPTAGPPADVPVPAPSVPAPSAAAPSPDATSGAPVDAASDRPVSADPAPGAGPGAAPGAGPAAG
ncbi:hypothetical protein KNE206_20560 [Kitasatospora sp. NE20-6]